MKSIITLSVSLLILIMTGCNNPGQSLQEKKTDQSESKIPYLEKQGTAARLVVDGKPFLMISGELHNSTCGGFEYMRPVWKRMAAKNLNSVIATVSWELVEPEEGKFDFTLVDSTIAGARQAGPRLPEERIPIQRVLLYKYK